MSITNKHLQHLRSRLCEYKQIRKDEIPSGVTIESKSSIPTSAEILELFKQNIQPAEYIQVTTNNWYYQLEGKAPSPEIVLYGELAVSYQKGYERVFFKNSENELVSLQPITYTDSTVKGESTNIDVEVKQENGKLTNVIVTDRTQEAITNAISELDSDINSEATNIDVQVIQEDGKITAVVVNDRTEEAIESGIRHALQQLDGIAEGTSDKFDITIYQTDGVISDINIVDKMGNLADDLNANVTSTNGTNVNVQVIQQEGKITAVNVTDNTQTAINTAISNLDLSDTINTAITESIQTLDETLVSESNNLKIELTQTDGLISELIITDNITETIEESIETTFQQLDSTVTSVTENDTKNINVEIIQENGKLSSINVIDNTNEAIANAIEEAVFKLDSTVTGNNDNINIKIQQIDGKLSSVVVTDKGLSKKLVINNNELTVNENKECIWSIPYTQLQEVGIDPDTAGVFIREIKTGIQLIPDIQFNNTYNNLIIKFSSENTIPANTYKIIIIS